MMNDHGDCLLSDNCGRDDCPKVRAAAGRAAAGAAPWGVLELGADGGGRRHFLGGQPVTCGTILELQGMEDRSDEWGEYTVPTKTGVIVSYEADLGKEGAPVTLYLYLGGHVFKRVAEPWMRFRWPRGELECVVCGDRFDGEPWERYCGGACQREGSG